MRFFVLKYILNVTWPDPYRRHVVCRNSEPPPPPPPPPFHETSIPIKVQPPTILSI